MGYTDGRAVDLHGWEKALIVAPLRSTEIAAPNHATTFRMNADCYQGPEDKRVRVVKKGLKAVGLSLNERQTTF